MKSEQDSVGFVDIMTLVQVEDEFERCMLFLNSDYIYCRSDFAKHEMKKRLWI